MQRRLLVDEINGSMTVHTDERLSWGEEEIVPSSGWIPRFATVIFSLGIGIERIVVDRYSITMFYSKSFSDDLSALWPTVREVMKSSDPDIKMDQVSECWHHSEDPDKHICVMFSKHDYCPLSGFPDNIWISSEKNFPAPIIRDIMRIPGIDQITISQLSGGRIMLGINRSHFGRWPIILPEVRRTVSEHRRFRARIFGMNKDIYPIG